MDYDDELARLWIGLAEDLVALGRVMSEAEHELLTADAAAFAHWKPSAPPPLAPAAAC